MKQLDLFSFSPSLQVCKDEGFKTNIGGVITSVISVGFLLSCFAFSRELFEKSNPFILNSLNFDATPALSKDSISFFFAPMLMGGFTIPESDKLLKMYLVMIQTDNSLQDKNLSIFTQFRLKKCLDSKQFNNTSMNTSSFLIGDINNYYCVYPNDYEGLLDMYGSFGNPKFTIWNIKVEACTNSTENSFGCKPMEEIKTALSMFYVHFGIRNVLIDSFDYSNPLKPTFYSKLLRVSSFNSRIDTVFITPITYTTDSGFILEDSSSLESFQISRVESDSLYSDSPTSIMGIILTIENLKLKIFRGYTKVQAVAASIGGFAKFLILVLGYISKRINEMYFYKYMHQVSLPIQSKISLNLEGGFEMDFPKKQSQVIEDTSIRRIKELVSESTKNTNKSFVNNYVVANTNLKVKDICSFLTYCHVVSQKSRLQHIKEAFNFYYTIENVILSASKNIEPST